MIWKFKNEQKRKISKLSVKVSSSTFESGKVLWTLCAGEFCTRLQPGPESNQIELDSEAEEITLTAMVSGAEFWQHAQLFRQKSDDTSDMMIVRVDFAL